MDVNDEECEECAGGGKIAGALLLAVGAAVTYMGADLLTGGAVSRFVAGAAFGRGVAPEELPGDNEEQDGAADSPAGEGVSDDDAGDPPG